MATTPSISIDASRLHALLDRFDDAEPIVQREGGNALARSAAQVEADAKRNVTDVGAVDTGMLRRSIAVELRPGNSPIEASIGSNLQYAETIEIGRRPGAKAPPQGALLDWMRRHGIPPEKEYVMRMRIARFGIDGRPYLGPALTDNEATIQREFDLAADRALAVLLR